MEMHILEEARRCIRCGACVKGCPVNTAIPDMIRMLVDGQIVSAGRTLFQNNPLSVVCSIVCPQERQCEGHCVLGRKGAPIRISDIEHYISSFYMNVMDLEPLPKKGKSVAIVGSGPAGITIAFLLALRGYSITIYEGKDQIGGVMRYGIPEFRLPKDLIDGLEANLRKLGVIIRPNTTIGATLSLDDLFRDGFSAVFVGTGVWRPKGLGIPGESLGNCHFAIDYLKNPDVYRLGRTLCVIGAGNTAMDVARTAVRKGVSHVTVMYRKGWKEMPARKIEVEYAQIDGVDFMLESTPVAITSKGVRFVRDGEEDFFPCESVIVAVSQGPRSLIGSSRDGIETREDFLVADDSGHTSREGVFASGDVVTGAKTVVEAVRFSKKVVEAMDSYLRGTD
ncbi:4Fe-4S ferredoxin iron-sulfur binding domain protein [Dethiosulfovibrio peptidovorans DSM 11002]|uniref:4Fe-4S ferredoxin iron-sulfur binding domain protein n=1 Tax=Dethiosulfovibrio peptidovorans DSM 11002 TaxID=469381 RepID=D2Z7M2_9BACT|nr:NAD(P)-dependent oxidoreductase [Dethiosulfovibrio peptidovorans]EFC91469.1 4Fe-4S ferredoxin iron-sulfur binding domain protein [Dethiosulfovibrio peptidovorans DSM 11002]